MRELTAQETMDVSGAGITIPTFPTAPGLGGGLTTIVGSVGYAVAVIGINLGLGLAEILGSPAPVPH